MLTIARICLAANKLREENADVNFHGLASKLNCSYDEVRYFVAMRPAVKGQIGLVGNVKRLFPGLVLLSAAHTIRDRGEFVTLKSLAREAGRGPSGLRMMLTRHPGWREKIGILDQDEANRMSRAKKYETMIREMFSEKIRPNQARIARRCGIGRQTVWRDFDRNPRLRELLKPDASAKPDVIAQETDTAQLAK